MEGLVSSGAKLCSEIPYGFAALMVDGEGSSALERCLELLYYAPTLMDPLLVRSTDFPPPRGRLSLTLRRSPLGRALARLGLDAVKDVIATALLEPLFEAFSHGGADELRTHGLSIGELAKRLGDAHHLGRGTFMMAAGGLHDVGQGLLLRHGGDAYLELLAEAEGGDVCHLEREVLGFDHSELGEAVLGRLGLPQALSSLVRDHHHFSIRLQQMPGGSHLGRLALLTLAQVMGEELEPGLGNGVAWRGVDDAARYLGLDPTLYWAVNSP